MPGVGVGPGLRGFFNSSADGIPSAGETFDGTVSIFVFAGIPGVEFALGSIGLVERPGGRFAGFTVTFAPVLLFAVFELASGAEPHALKHNTAPAQTNAVL